MGQALKVRGVLRKSNIILSIVGTTATDFFYSALGFWKAIRRGSCAASSPLMMVLSPAFSGGKSSSREERLPWSGTGSESGIRQEVLVGSGNLWSHVFWVRQNAPVSVPIFAVLIVMGVSCTKFGDQWWGIGKHFYSKLNKKIYKKLVQMEPHWIVRIFLKY